MRKGIHPEYVESKVFCSCGATFTTRSTQPEMHLELCSQCHPFFTGKQKFVDTGGRVQRFSDKFGNAADAVMKKEAAEKEARIKAAEEAAEAARKLREEREAARVKAEAAAAKAAPKAEAPAEAPAEEAPAEEPAAEPTEAPAEEPAAEGGDETAE